VEKEERFVLVAVGCIECGKQTEVLGIFNSEEEISEAFEKFAKEKGIEEWSPRGGILEFIGQYEKSHSSYLGGCGYFDGGQFALEVHVVPKRELESLDSATQQSEIQENIGKGLA